MQFCAVDYALTYITTTKLQLVNWTVADLTAAKFNPVILPIHGFFLSNIKYSWISMV
jgi:hypothetical protein